MSENFNSHIACEGTDNDINWVCKVCKDLPNYAGMYLYQREREKNQLKNVKDRCADLILMKYYYALLHLLDKIHELHECSNPENDVPKYADRKCSIPECFVYYRYIYNTYASILMTEKGLNQINLRCDICSVLPYTIFSDLEMIAKNMHSDDMEKTQKLEIEAVIADYYLEAVGFCEQWDECPSGVDWLELIKSVQLLRKYLEKKDRKEDAKHTSAFREENGADGNDEAAAAKARTGTATRSSGSKVVRMPSSNSELEVCIVKPSNIGEAQQVCDTLLNDHPVVVNLEGIDLMEAQRIMDFISGCIFAISGNMCQVSRFIFIFSPNGVEISGDYIKSLETEESYNIASFNKEF